MTQSESARVLLFDLGGVLVDWAGIDPLLQLTKGRLAPEEARTFWLESHAVRAFELGNCSAEDFASAVVAALKLECSPASFITQFETWDRGPFPDAMELLRQLSARHHVSCLSNNNELHWRRLREHRGFLEQFRETFVSFEIKKMKPDPEAFEFVLAALKKPASDIVFFDDNIECVTAANRLGMNAHHVKGVTAVRAVLAGLNIEC